jgi:hypothetical protein
MKMLTREEWRNFPRWRKYQVKSDGRIGRWIGQPFRYEIALEFPDDTTGYFMVHDLKPANLQKSLEPA